MKRTPKITSSGRRKNGAAFFVAAGLLCVAAAAPTALLPFSAAFATGLPVASSIVSPIAAAGAAQVERSRENNRITSVEVKAALMWSHGQEDLFLSPRCSGKVENFAYIVPVPTRPQVNILRGALFHDLERLADNTIVFSAGMSPDSIGSADSVKVIEQKVVGAYEVSVLSSDDSAALGVWLQRNKYVLPQAAKAPLQAYVDKGWLFVACRIKDPASAQGIQTGTLAPIHLHFAAPRPILPIQFCRANPSPVRVMAYVLIPEAEAKAANCLQSLKVEQGPISRVKQATRSKATAAADQTEYETLFRLQKGVAWRLYEEAQDLRPEVCIADYVWSLNGSGGGSRRAGDDFGQVNPLPTKAAPPK